MIKVTHQNKSQVGKEESMKIEGPTKREEKIERRKLKRNISQSKMSRNNVKNEINTITEMKI
jgi:hypothetical protein